MRLPARGTDAATGSGCLPLRYTIENVFQAGLPECSELTQKLLRAQPFGLSGPARSGAIASRSLLAHLEADTPRN